MLQLADRTWWQAVRPSTVNGAAHMSARIVLHGDDDELRHIRAMHWDLADLDDHRELHGWPDGVIGHHHIDAEGLDADLGGAAPDQDGMPRQGAAD